MPTVACAMCGEPVEVPQATMDRLMSRRKSRNKNKIDDEVYCLKHTKMALMKYDK